MTFEIGSPAPGDGTWIVDAHVGHYGESLGYGEAFRTTVSGVVTRMLAAPKEGREAFWIARAGGVPIGSVICWEEAEEVARLRLFFVAQDWRGRGVGRALLETCVGFAREAGYAEILLNTTAAQHEARALYERAGFRCTPLGRSDAYGSHHEEECWRRAL